jgi:hypothetical protein
MRLYPLALVAGLLPIITIHISYLWAASNGHVEWCIPYIDSCTSISATGRSPPESYLFKALMIPSAMFLAAYWWYSCHWLVALGCTARKRRMILLAIAIAASVGLIVYSVMLGSIGENYRLHRRIGVTTFFGLSYLAQLLITNLLGNTHLIRQRYSRWLQSLEISCLTVLLVGLTSIAISIIDDDLYHRIDDAFEWTINLLLCTHVVISALLWKKTGFSSKVELT